MARPQLPWPLSAGFANVPAILPGFSAQGGAHVFKAKALIAAAMAVLIGFVALQSGKIPGLEGFGWGPKGAPPTAGSGNTALPVNRASDTIRIATFNIQVFGESKAQNAPVMDVLARIARNFDVIAVQEIRARNQDVVPYFVEQINAAGRHYDYVIGERLGRSDSKEQYAFIFDKQSVEALADAVHREHGGALERRGIERGCGVRIVMSSEGDGHIGTHRLGDRLRHALLHGELGAHRRTPLPLRGGGLDGERRQDSVEREHRIVVEHDLGDLARVDERLFEAVVDGGGRERRIVLDTREALLLRRRDDRTVAHQRGRRVVVEG
jgi:hypothetical protein